MRAVAVLAAVAALCFAGISANAQTVPAQRDQVAYPGGHVPGDPKVALVKIADGLHDPVGVASAFDGCGHVFVWSASAKYASSPKTVNCSISRFSI